MLLLSSMWCFAVFMLEIYGFWHTWLRQMPKFVASIIMWISDYYYLVLVMRYCVHVTRGSWLRGFNMWFYSHQWYWCWYIFTCKSVQMWMLLYRPMNIFIYLFIVRIQCSAICIVFNIQSEPKVNCIWPTAFVVSCCYVYKICRTTRIFPGICIQ